MNGLFLGRRARVKRALDLGGAIVGLCALSPLLLLLAACVRITLGTPVLFRQERPGLDSRIFVLWKFRTMKEGRDAQGRLLRDENRLTRLGRFLRQTSLDELPELWNVLRGEMSLVGPRPLLVDYLPLYTAQQARRHQVRPGITGLAQSSGRNALDWEQRFDLDVWYVENWTVALDLRILARTLVKVVKREGISGKSTETMQPFCGAARKEASIP